jgi:23S rRNA (uracil1939-C5)-methyltransferase
MQHWPDADYAAWKSGQVEAALRRAGFAATLAPPERTPPGARRRMDLALRREGSGTILVGLHAPRSTGVVNLHECHVLAPALFALLAPLRALLPTLAAFRRDGSAIANLLDSGPELLLRLDAPVTAGDRTRLAAFAAAHDVSRIACAVGRTEPEVACQLRPATTALGGVSVAVPPGTFLQASPQGERAIVEAVLAGLPERLPGRAWIAEMFAGCGTLTFPLAGRARVVAFEGDAAAASALRAAANAAGLAGRVTAHQRDLTQRPVLASELTGCAAVVLDPPHAGAAAQVPELSRAGVPRVIYVSCNPAALARDAASLHRAGYRLLAATAIDQFLWSARVESVSVFAR